MKKLLQVSAVLGLVCAAVVGISAITYVRADGAPTSQPLAYSGSLEESGQPVDGIRDFTLRFFTEADAVDPGCSSASQSTPVSNGRFRVLVTDECTAYLRANAETWIDVEVVDPESGATHRLPRVKIGAVPYALESDHARTASAATGTLAGQVVPTGMIALFAGPCPAGWSEYSAMVGRFPRGASSGASLGQGGSDDAIVVAHTHTATVTVASGGAHTHPMPCSWSANTNHSHNGNPGTISESPNPPGAGACNPISTESAGGHSHTGSATIASQGSSGAGGRIPRYQDVTYCMKN